MNVTTLEFPLTFLSRSVSNKPGTCVKVLTLDPHDWQLQDGMALLADSALPADLRVRHGHTGPAHERATLVFTGLRM